MLPNTEHTIYTLETNGKSKKKKHTKIRENNPLNFNRNRCETKRHKFVQLNFSSYPAMKCYSPEKKIE